jgi:flagellar motor switch protein FliN/FliY
MNEPAKNLEPEEGDSPEQTEAQADAVNNTEDIKLYPDAAEAQRPEFEELSDQSSENRGSMDLLLDIELLLTVELGRTTVTLRDVLELTPGSVVELQRMAGEPVSVFVNKKLIARGEVVVIDEKFGIRITEIVRPSERIEKIQ